jgi:hypothetical protein
MGMMLTRCRWWQVTLLVLALALAACGEGALETDVQVSPLALDSPILPDPSTLTVEPTLVPTPTPAPVQIELVVLHTNDNWGETEPCG